MLARCFMVITFLAVSIYPGISGRPNVLMVAPTIRVDGHPQAVLTIKCGDGHKPGVVVYWHTPFGPFHSPGLHTELNPVHMCQSGSLVVYNLSDLHQGLYYCLLQHDDGGSTLFPYELHMQAKDGERGPRFRRALKKQEAVSDEVFVAAVTTAVLLTFVFGFSAGALSRTPLLRCLRAITKRRRSPRQRRPDITMPTLTSCPSSPSSPSSSSSLRPPAKPQRSFRDKRSQDEKGEDNPAAAYLEACDHVDDEKGRISLRGGTKGEEGRRWRSMEEEKEVPAYDGMMEKNEKEQNEDDRKNRNEDERKNRREDGDENIISQSSQSDNDNQNQEVESFSRPSRVIRVYQYDQDGHRYSHLPDPEPDPTARTKQRSISLSRLNAIMAAASAGPMDTPPLPKNTL